MSAALRHRGPADEGFVRLSPRGNGAGPEAVFGFRRLAILDLSPAGHQPMIDPVSGDCLVFNGEIYNYRELREQLRDAGAVFGSTGDAEVLLKALSVWGESAVDRLDGMYAFAFYHRQTGRILLARDPLGIKPLYVARTAGRLLFASEVRALLASGAVRPDLDPAGVASFLAYGAPQDPLTVHRDIRSFPCGTAQWIHIDTDGALREESGRTHWRFPAVEDDRTMEQAARLTGDALRRSVRRQLASDVPLGVFLSGGIDSGAIAALAAELVGRLKTFAVGFESDTMTSELPVARRTAQRIGSDHHEIVIGKADALALWQQWLAAADRPSVDGFNTFVVSKAARDAGAKVVLSGLGADELFGGYANFFRVRRLAPAMRTAVLVPPATRVAAARLLAPLCPPRYRDRLAILAGSSGKPVDIALDIRRMLSTATIAAVGLEAADIGLGANFMPAELYALCGPREQDPFRAVSRAESYGYMSNTLLRDSDVDSMAHSLELRVPFLGREVVEEAALTPGRLHLERGVPKAVLRRAVGHLLPPEVLRRPKTGFTLPVGDWLYGELREAAEAAVASLAAVPFLDHLAVKRTWTAFERDRGHTYWMKPTLLVALGSYVSELGRFTGPGAALESIRAS